ncbi:dTDP-4-dehydrorhamnose 3,5-epimerase [Tamlana fucoidanivorans]|uniref:dTDP-4-dehydrorhamnose 3,5-epimerase n=1 Tax=Allotamlana fucoidanivorans TaxID=2583814 RepID=A0A5C4SRP9_9FLAO|nr:dTDP-4-dehydrorhamnose 3,5-epimerase [Tamlana fucoidanivorans]TNJ47053.1 dTDP-4-dehydrorhamnose 3,5-epimerase [Tamlana fucoidanivorans]
MKIEESNLKGCFVITPDVFEDERGYFFESFNAKTFQELTGQAITFVQDNQSKSSKGVLRGLHYQRGAHAQTKLVRVIKGKVLDVCVDLREGSETYGKHFSIILDAIKHQQLFIPKGFAHGFVVLEDDTLFSYKCDAFYNKASEAGILFNDKTLNIDWMLSEDELIISEKDLKLPSLESYGVK